MTQAEAEQYFSGSIDAAKKRAKALFENACLISGQGKGEVRLDGCHLYPAGSFAELKKCWLNIYPLAAALHQAFDWVKYGIKQRETWQKKAWLVEHITDFAIRERVVMQLELLDEVAKAKGVLR